MLSQYQVDVCLTNGAEWRFYSISARDRPGPRVIEVNVRNSGQQAARYIKTRLPSLQEKPGLRLASIQESKDREGDDDNGDADKENDGSSNDQPSTAAYKDKGNTAGGSKGEAGDRGNSGNTARAVGGGTKRGKRQEDVCAFAPLPPFFEDQLGVFTQQELELLYLQTLPCIQQYLD